MIQYRYIPLGLLNIVRDMVAQFREQGGVVVVTGAEPEFLPDDAHYIDTGIVQQDGSVLYISQYCVGFCVEGDLWKYGLGQMALDLGCIPFDTSNQYLEYIRDLEK